MAGNRLPAAVPDVVTTAAGCPEARAIPMAVNAAERSSMRTCSRRVLGSAASASAYTSGAEREPGPMTTCCTPESRSAVTMARAVSMESMRPILRVLHQHPVRHCQSLMPPALPVGGQFELFEYFWVGHRGRPGGEHSVGRQCRGCRFGGK